MVAECLWSGFVCFGSALGLAWLGLALLSLALLGLAWPGLAQLLPQMAPTSIPCKKHETTTQENDQFVEAFKFMNFVLALAWPGLAASAGLAGPGLACLGLALLAWLALAYLGLLALA